MLHHTDTPAAIEYKRRLSHYSNFSAEEIKQARLAYEATPEYKAHKEEQDRKFAEARKAAKELEEKVQAELQHIKRYMRDRGNVGHVAYNRISTALDALDFVDENEDDIARCECDQFYFIKDAIEDGDEVFCSAECCQSYLDQRAHERTLRGPQ